MAVKTAAELKAYFETGDKPTQSQFEDLIDTIFSMGSTPTTVLYRALLSQSGTDAPTAIVLENNLGEDVNWSYLNVGVFLGNTNSGFIETETGMILQHDTDNYIYFGGGVVVNTKSSGVNANNQLYNTYIEIIKKV